MANAALSLSACNAAEQHDKAAAAASVSPGNLAIIHEHVDAGQEVEQPMASYSREQLAALKQVELAEKDPDDGASAKFRGLSLFQLIEDAAAKLSVEERAHIDLVVLEGAGGKTVFVPRGLLKKYATIQLALKRDGKDLGPVAPAVVLPTSNARLAKEGLLLDALRVKGVQKIVLTSYEQRFGSYFLKRRTDPAAMRGEKLFMQNCLGCHATLEAGQSLAGPEKIQKLQSTGHPTIEGAPEVWKRLDAKEQRSVLSYLDAFRSQVSQTAQK